MCQIWMGGAEGEEKGRRAHGHEGGRRGRWSAVEGGERRCHCRCRKARRRRTWRGGGEDVVVSAPPFTWGSRPRAQSMHACLLACLFGGGLINLKAPSGAAAMMSLLVRCPLGSLEVEETADSHYAGAPCMQCPKCMVHVYDHASKDARDVPATRHFSASDQEVVNVDFPWLI